jgi:maltose alpha-D-glucosyltransferase/alpha-amylase
VFRLLRQRLDTLTETDRPKAEALIAAESQVIDRYRRLVGQKIAAERIRTHGDYHLGQVLHTGKDFVIIDFEGEPSRSLSERRLKRSPFRDVAGMLRSFHYAAYAKLFEEAAAGVVTAPEALAELETWSIYWERWISAAFLRAYLDRAHGASFMPSTRQELETLLDVYILEKAVYELQYELNNRPTWVGIPLQGIQQILGVPSGAR